MHADVTFWDNVKWKRTRSDMWLFFRVEVEEEGGMMLPLRAPHIGSGASVRRTRPRGKAGARPPAQRLPRLNLHHIHALFKWMSPVVPPVAPGQRSCSRVQREKTAHPGLVFLFFLGLSRRHGEDHTPPFCPLQPFTIVSTLS